MTFEDSNYANKVSINQILINEKSSVVINFKDYKFFDEEKEYINGFQDYQSSKQNLLKLCNQHQEQIKPFVLVNKNIEQVLLQNKKQFQKSYLSLIEKFLECTHFSLKNGSYNLLKTSFVNKLLDNYKSSTTNNPNSSIKPSDVSIQIQNNNFLPNQNQQQQQMNNQQTNQYQICQKPDDKFDLYNMRYLIVILYILSDLANSLQYSTFTPIAAQLVQIYNVEPIMVNMAALVYLILMTPVTFIATYVVDVYGPTKAIKLGLILTLFGGWIRVFVNEYFSIIIFGNVFAAIGAPFIYYVKSCVAAYWFSQPSRPLVTMIIAFFGTIASILAVLIPGLWFGGYEYQLDNKDFTQGKKLTMQLLFFEASVTTTVTIITFFFFQDKPPTPPSFSATIQRQQIYLTVLSELFKKNLSYRKLVFAASLMFGSFTGLAVSISFVVQPFGFNQSDTSTMLVAMPIAGIVGVWLFSNILKKNKCYKKSIISLCIMGSISVCAFLGLLEFGKIYIGLIGTAFIGFLMAPVIPIIYEFGTELAFPIGEGSAVGFIIGISAISSFLFGLLFSSIVQGETRLQSYIGGIITSGAIVIGMFIIMCTKETLQRIKTDDNYQTQQTNYQNQLTLTATLHNYQEPIQPQQQQLNK